MTSSGFLPAPPGGARGWGAPPSGTGAPPEFAQAAWPSSVSSSCRSLAARASQTPSRWKRCELKRGRRLPDSHLAPLACSTPIAFMLRISGWAGSPIFPSLTGLGALIRGVLGGQTLACAVRRGAHRARIGTHDLKSRSQS
ncbi:unnamed protein product [Prorocentrum cordatum]|uniref:Uncharacterized protein n=1 Tax=Prorocentrum cordatum TaxID=2364126 RepID=A0ABN9QVR5_9DINO|nr:unnamed protein product [Polarella glacialis]